ncbi:hypothetical protein GCM10018962_12540 [Dactylosporangium matsuzakiense]|uniref:Uncharacterized protein n=2 Tax=Dactylosporangium matsuzakiense TaxID=53360 RepID=A0A9W6KP17_9ACTN|nr:hypothetical protein GCM10017581_054260 [Dactylosporangium matsuzakiense]
MTRERREFSAFIVFVGFTPSIMTTMSHRWFPSVLLCAAALVGGCGGTGDPTPAPSAAEPPETLLTAKDLPGGYSPSPPDATPEVTVASSASVAGCDEVLDYFRDGGPAPGAKQARFEAGGAGPFLAESLSTQAPALAERAGPCRSFTDTDGAGATTSVSVAPVTDFPSLGADEHVFTMTAGGGTGDDAYAMSGYLVEVRVGTLTCTIVHFGQPGVDRAETESIARAAVEKIKRQR